MELNNVLYLDNDNLVALTGLKDSAAAAYLNNATVQLTVLAPDGAELAGVVWPQPMAYVVGSKGEYRYTLPVEAALQHSVFYTLRIVVSAPLRGTFLKTVRAQGRYA
jgi:hypothetical protein